MSGPEPEWMLTSWVRLVQARWVATGVSRDDRSDLLRQLLRDLAAARAAGASIDELVATSPAVFADSCAAGLKSRTTGIDTASLLLVCLGTGVIATGMTWLLLITRVVNLPSEPPLGLDQSAFFLFLVLFFAAAVLAAMVAAVRWTFRHRLEVAAVRQGWQGGARSRVPARLGLWSHPGLRRQLGRCRRGGADCVDVPRRSYRRCSTLDAPTSSPRPGGAGIVTHPGAGRTQ